MFNNIKSITLFGSIILLLSGCNIKGDTMKDKEDVLAYLEKQYDTEFIYNDYSANQSDYAEITAYAADLPDKRIFVYVSKDAEDNFAIRDNYMAYYFQEELEEKVKGLIERVYHTEAIVKTVVMDKALEELYEKDTSLEDISSDNSHIYLLYIAICNNGDLWEKRENDINCLLSELKDTSIYVNGSISYLSESDFEIFTEQNFFDETNWKWDKGVGTFSTDIDGEVLEIKWY